MGKRLPRKKKLRVVCLQVNAGADWQKNLICLEGWLRKAFRIRPNLITLPEVFVCRGHDSQLSFLAQEVTPRVLELFCRIARQKKTAFLLGSLIEKSKNPKRFYNTSYLIQPSGQVSARYRKIHLFDVEMQDKVSENESRLILPGRKVVTTKLGDIALGLTVCYDLRFPELFRKLAKQGVRIAFVPANFTRYTGQAHWEILLRARAIENQMFLVAPAQAGVHPVKKVPSFGHSMIVDPWGRILKRAPGRQEALIWADLDFSEQDSLRKFFPVLKHRRL